MSEAAAINLKEWIHIDSIESLLNHFNQRLTAQELKYAALQNLCQEFFTKAAFDNFSQHVESELDSISGLLDRLDRRTTIPIDGEALYCDQVLTHHSEKLLKIKQQCEALVTENSFNRELEKISEKFSAEIRELKEQSATYDFTDRIAVCTASMDFDMWCITVCLCRDCKTN